MRLFHRLFLLFSVTAIVAALAMASVLTWNLNRGFGEYLEARDQEMLDTFAADMENEIAALSANEDPESDVSVAQLAVETLARQGRIPERPPGIKPPFERDEKVASGEAVQDERLDRPPPPEGPRAGPEGRRPPPDAFGARLRVSDGAGELVFGPPFVPREIEDQISSRPIAIDGETAAFVELLPRGPTPRSVDTGFLEDQHFGAAVVTALLLILSGISAWFLAQKAERRINSLKDATTAISAGDFATRVDLAGTDEFAQMGNNINSMAESLDRLENARRRWLAEISHELRTPLTILRGELDALEDGIRPINMTAVESLSDEARRLHLLIEDLHFLAVSELGTPSQRLSSADAVQIVHEIKERFGAALDDANLS